MIALVEGAQRQKTPNEIALNILLSGLTIIFLLAVDARAVRRLLAGAADGVCADLPAGLSYSDYDRRAAVSYRHRRHGPSGPVQRASHVSGRAVEAAGDVNTLLLDKTGTITLGNRQASSSCLLPE